MRQFLSILTFALVLGCAQPEEPPVVDMPDEPAQPAAPSFAGDWTVQAMPLDSDSALVELGMTTADNTDGWSMQFDHLDEPVPASSVVIAGDSATVTVGPYSSALRDEVMVTTTSVIYVNGDDLMGRFSATYDDAESTVLEGRLRGTRRGQ
ncbi:MAG: hypothetical protein HKN04_01635 [Rhodothermaceae bacterium]|nr:hypothetical protein [Rhodothermaceae bacterium]